MADIDQKDIPNTGPDQPVPKPAEPVHDPAHKGHIESDLPRLRTFADDLSEEIKKKGATTASIVQAERERAAREVALDQEPEAPRPGTWKNPLILGTTLVLIGIGVATLVGAYFYTSLVSTVAPQREPSIIFPNKVVPVTQERYESLPEALARERGAVNLELGGIERMDLVSTHASTTPQDILRAFGAPEMLVREARQIMLGVHSFNRNQPFLIIEVTQYDRAYGAMLSWEEEMARTLGTFFKPEGGAAAPTLTFTDKVFQNIDTRVSQNEWPILWAFPRRDVLVITTNQYTLSEITTRLFAQRTGVQE